MSAPMKLKLQHVSSYPNKNGSLRYYFRRRGQPMQRLPDDPMSPEFMEDYQRHLNATSPAITMREGTFGWLCDQYMDTPDFRSKEQSTQKSRRRIILTMVSEPIAPNRTVTFGEEKAKNIGLAHITVLRDRKEAVPHAANERLKILSQIFKMAVSRGFVERSPMEGVTRLRTRSGGHRTATDEHLAQYLAYHSSGAPWLAMVILMETGMRVSDLRLFGRQNVKNGELSFVTVKTGVRVTQPVSTLLQSALDSARKNMTFVLNEHGKPFASDKSISFRVSKWFRQAGVEEISAHGVRKWCATKKAEEGWTDHELMAWFGWRTIKEAQTYTQEASRARIAREAVRRRVR